MISNHFPVLRADKATTKTRIVSNAYERYQGISLNDQIHHGPKIQNELFNVLLRFRKYPVGVICEKEFKYRVAQITFRKRLIRLCYMSLLTPHRMSMGGNICQV